MSDDEIAHFFYLLHRFCEQELDQWEFWQLDTKFSKVYMYMGRAPPGGHNLDAYIHIPAPSSQPTTRRTEARAPSRARQTVQPGQRARSVPVKRAKSG